ncbi:hypothetical protein AOLI_G00162540 [Acnodon oligacanthus]
MRKIKRHLKLITASLPIIAWWTQGSDIIAKSTVGDDSMTLGFSLLTMELHPQGLMVTSLALPHVVGKRGNTEGCLELVRALCQAQPAPIFDHAGHSVPQTQLITQECCCLSSAQGAVTISA